MTQHKTYREGSAHPRAPEHRPGCYFELDDVGWHCADDCPEKPRYEAIRSGQPYRRPEWTDAEMDAYLEGWLDGRKVTEFGKGAAG